MKSLENADKSLTQRVKALEQSSTDHEDRIVKIEEAVFVPTPLPE